MPKLEELLKKTIKNVSDAVQVGKQAGLSLTSKKELLAILQIIATHTGHFIDGKIGRKFCKNAHNPVILLHGYLQNNSSFAGIDINLRKLLGGDDSSLYKAYSKFISIFDEINYGQLLITRRTLKIKGLEDYLFNRGMCVDSPSYGFYRNLNEIAEESIHRAEKIINMEHSKKADIVGHSLGGLVALYAGVKRPDLFQRVVAIAAPYRGTIMANIAHKLTMGLAGESAEQMKEGSEFIRKLNKMNIPESIIIYNFIAEYDALIPRPEKSFIDDKPNVVNKLIEGIGHVGIIGPEVYPYVYAALTDNFQDLGLIDKKEREVSKWIKKYCR